MASSSVQTSARPPRWLGRGTLRACDFTGPDYRILDAEVTAQDALLAGHLQAWQVQPGLWLHGVEARDLRTMSTRSPAVPGLHLVVLLEGCVDVAFGNQGLQLQVAPSSPAGAHAQACGAVIHSRPGDLFTRHWRRGKFERKLSITVQPQWFAAQSLPMAAPAMLRHWMEQQVLAIEPWQPSPRAVAVAEQIIQLAREGSAPLLLASRTLELVHEALQALDVAEPEPAPTVLGVREHRRMARLKALLDSGGDGCRTLAEIAREVGLSASALQRQFRQAYGSSIDEYRREQRLERAWAALEQTGCNVSEVAHAAGYTSAANFSTAFKRRFGISPKLVRARL
jgi:AraC-like DNA-binding protein